VEKTSKVTVKGQILIPGEIRKRHHIEPGSEVRFMEYGNVVCLVPVVKEPVDDAYGFLRDDGPLAAEELLRERRTDFRNE
jgi:AbrB family looped-hinge helix DNA binding protein